MPKIRILLAEDHKIVREGIRLILEQEPDLEIVAEAPNGRKAVELVRELRPDVVLMDLSMPEMNGIDATRWIESEEPGVRVLALSMHSDRRYVTEALSAGAKGYLLKDCAAHELVRAIHTVAADEAYLSPRIAGVVVNDFLGKRSPGAGSAGTASLSPREREVLQLLAEGKSTKEAAFMLNLSPKTIETHRMQIMKKLNIFNVAELTKYAIREGLTTVD